MRGCRLVLRCQTARRLSPCGESVPRDAVTRASRASFVSRSVLPAHGDATASAAAQKSCRAVTSRRSCSSLTVHATSSSRLGSRRRPAFLDAAGHASRSDARPRPPRRLLCGGCASLQHFSLPVHREGLLRPRRVRRHRRWLGPSIRVTFAMRSSSPVGPPGASPGCSNARPGPPSIGMRSWGGRLACRLGGHPDDRSAE